jgi:hypothetical protein
MKIPFIFFISLTIGLFSCEKESSMVTPPDSIDSTYFGLDTFTIDFLFLDRFNHTPIKGMYNSVFKFKSGDSYDDYIRMPNMRMYSDENGHMYGKIPIDSSYIYTMYFSHDRGAYSFDQWITISGVGGAPPTYTHYPYPLSKVRLRFPQYQQVDSLRVDIRQRLPHLSLTYTSFESSRFNRPDFLYHYLGVIGFNDAYITYKFKQNGVWGAYTQPDTVYIPPHDTIIYDLHL